MIPTWTYVKSKDALYVNMFVGSRIHVGQVAGTNVEVVQKTEYPWHGSVSITVNPEEPKTFSVYVRIPDRTTSKLYKRIARDPGREALRRQWTGAHADDRKGYAVVTREWKPATASNWNCRWSRSACIADERIEADVDLVALKYGPLVYNVETADNQNIDRKLSDAPLQAEWRRTCSAASW